MNMLQKPKEVWILIATWIIMGIILIGVAIQRAMQQMQLMNMYNAIPYSQFSFSGMFNFTFIFLILFDVLSIVIVFLLIFLTVFSAYKIIWLLGVIYTSALLYFVYSGLMIIGVLISSGYYYPFFNNFSYLSVILMTFIVPIALYFVTRPTVRKYYEKPEISTQNNYYQPEKPNIYL